MFSTETPRASPPREPSLKSAFFMVASVDDIGTIFINMVRKLIPFAGIPWPPPSRRAAAEMAPPIEDRRAHRWPSGHDASWSLARGGARHGRGAHRRPLPAVHSRRLHPRLQGGIRLAESYQHINEKIRILSTEKAKTYYRPALGRPGAGVMLYRLSHPSAALGADGGG